MVNFHTHHCIVVRVVKVMFIIVCLSPCVLVHVFHVEHLIKHNNDNNNKKEYEYYHLLFILMVAHPHQKKYSSWHQPVLEKHMNKNFQKRGKRRMEEKKRLVLFQLVLFFL